MKIALCLSGQPRGIPISIEQVYNNIIFPLNADVFIHSWYSPECDNVSFDSAQPAQSNKVGRWLPESDKIIIKHLNPKKYLFEPPRQFEEFNDLPGPGSAVQTRLASLFYGIYQSNKLKNEFEIENNFKYDIVIRTRIDLVYKCPLDKNIILNLGEIQNNIIYTPKFYQDHRQYDSYPIVNDGHYSSMTDIFIMGNSFTMDKVCDIYPHFRKIHEKIYPYAYGESYIGYNTRHTHKIEVKTFDYYMDIMHRVIQPQ